MKERLIDWFFDKQLKLAFFLGCVCLVVVFSFDSSALQVLLSFLFSLLLIFAGNRLYLTETSENWLRFSYLEILKNIIGTVFVLIGWMILLRRVLALAIALIISKTI